MQKGSERSSSFYTENHGALNTEAEDSEPGKSASPQQTGQGPWEVFQSREETWG